GQAERPLLEDRVRLVPERECEAELTVLVRDPQQAVLAPAIGPGACVVVRKRVPGSAVGGVVLPHGAPLPLGEVRTPEPPRQPPGKWGASPSATSGRWPSPASSRWIRSGSRNRCLASCFASGVPSRTRTHASTNGPRSHGHTVPWWYAPSRCR